jgi:hypothetical protein
VEEQHYFASINVHLPFLLQDISVSKGHPTAPFQEMPNVLLLTFSKAPNMMEWYGIKDGSVMPFGDFVEKRRNPIDDYFQGWVCMWRTCNND